MNFQTANRWLRGLPSGLAALSLLLCNQISNAAAEHAQPEQYTITAAQAQQFHKFLKTTNQSFSLYEGYDPKNLECAKARLLGSQIMPLLHKDPSSLLIQNIPGIPFLSTLIWGGPYPDELNTITVPGLETEEIRTHQHKERRLIAFLQKTNALNRLHIVIDRNQLPASQLVLYRGFSRLLSHLPKKTLIALTPQGCLLFDMIKAKRGLIKVVNTEGESQTHTLNRLPQEWVELTATYPEFCHYFQYLQQLQHAITNCITGTYFTKKEDQEKLIYALQQVKARGDNSTFFLTWLSRTQLEQLRRNGDTNDNAREKTHTWLTNMAGSEALQDTVPNIGLAFHAACSVTDYKMIMQQLRSCFTSVLQALKNGTIKESQAVNRIKQIHKKVVNCTDKQKKRTPLHWVARNALGSKEKGTPLAKLEETIRSVLLLIVADADLSAKDQKNVAVPSFSSNSLRYLIKPGYNEKSSAAFTFRDPRWKLSNKNATQRLKNINLIYEHLFGNENVVGTQKQHKNNIRQHLLNCNNKGTGTTPITFDQLKKHSILVRQYLEQTLELFDLIETLPWTELLGFVSTSDRMITPNRIKAIAEDLAQQGL